MILSVVILGKAATQGSKTPIRNKAGQVVGMREDNPKSRPWRQDVAKTMLAARPEGFRVWDEAVAVEVTIYVPRPKSHFGTGRNAGILKDDAPQFPPNGLDCDKVMRAIGDAGTTVWWRDDSRISKITVERLYCKGEKPERTEIRATPRRELVAGIL